MGIHDLSAFRHQHAFDAGNLRAERRTWIVVAITATAMVGEIVAGAITGSLALLADGWHMATHVVALSITGFAYLLARRWSQDERFAFGTWKVEVLGAFSSALLLLLVALAMAWESVARLLSPREIQFLPALVVAVIGFAVNVLCARVLHQGIDHDRDPHLHHHHEHGDHAHHDMNLRSAYAHVITDALTSVLAIVALGAGLWGGWAWLDPLIGLVGAGVILWWCKGLLADSGRVLLDREMDAPVVDQLRRAIESDGDAEISDLHVWRVGRASYAAVVTVVAHRPLSPGEYRARVAGIPSLAHVSVEVNACEHRKCP